MSGDFWNKIPDCGRSLSNKEYFSIDSRSCFIPALKWQRGAHMRPRSGYATPLHKKWDGAPLGAASVLRPSRDAVPARFAAPERSAPAGGLLRHAGEAQACGGLQPDVFACVHRAGS